ncbi:NADH:flavin oxidoreductase [Paenibacillus aceris]|uniref:2,4-dienoyl-CoA reductase-like NADH-dependent reductase (Old Yellow Enzyme family) n=1 Tax=Paenibacillus aceris TaxID=869555 RepID=A0ABS4I4Z1_9BACL|nr:NADH:flavin oxidoreductase [Paenibacillus aceris]MBP1965986.1 2,4-dienoyl-CoA reductase-like NADH-dependent reductase (Old Yellow Enzyme family) [Paenibacillus aceris]NHW35017.1 NADH:flavin oxidoreductase [Paenibacillus aceris]
MSISHKLSVQPLFQPFTLNQLSLSNRIVMASMTRSFSPNGVPGADVAAYYRRRAENGIGLIVTEGAVIDHPAATGDPNIPNFHGEAALNGWAHVVKEVHNAGGKIVPQLWHVGITRRTRSEPNLEAPSISPSGIDLMGEKAGEPMTEAEIADVIKAYAESAANAKRLGFDGIELHGAHGYLIDQFFWEKTNQRTDHYGGDLVSRTRFAVEIIEACRQAVGTDFPIILRFSQWKIGSYDAKLAKTPEELSQFLAPLVEAGVDMFDCSTRQFWEPEFPGSELNLAGWTKKLTGKPTITAGSVGLESEPFDTQDEHELIDELVGRLAREEFDLAAIGRALLADPAWAAKIRDGRDNELVPYTSDRLTSLF